MPIRSIRGPETLTRFVVKGGTFRTFDPKTDGRPGFYGGFLKETVYVNNGGLKFTVSDESMNVATVALAASGHEPQGSFSPVHFPGARLTLNMTSTLSAGAVNLMKRPEISVFAPGREYRVILSGRRQIQLITDAFNPHPHRKGENTVFPDDLLKLAATYYGGKFGPLTGVNFHDNPFLVGSLPVNFVTLLLGTEMDYGIMTGGMRSTAALFIFDYIP